MRIMVWQVMMGAEINSVEFRYDRQGEAHFRIDLDSPAATVTHRHVTVRLAPVE